MLCCHTGCYYNTINPIFCKNDFPDPSDPVKKDRLPLLAKICPFIRFFFMFLSAVFPNGSSAAYSGITILPAIAQAAAVFGDAR